MSSYGAAGRLDGALPQKRVFANYGKIVCKLLYINVFCNISLQREIRVERPDAVSAGRRLLQWKKDGFGAHGPAENLDRLIIKFKNTGLTF